MPEPAENRSSAATHAPRGRDWPNLILSGKPVELSGEKDDPVLVFRIELDTPLTKAQAQAFREVRKFGRRQAADFINRVRDDLSRGMRQLVQLAFDGTQMVWGIHPWDLGIDLDPAKDGGPRVSRREPAHVEIAEDFGPSGNWQAAVRFIYDVPFDPEETEPDEVRGYTAEELKAFVMNLFEHTDRDCAVVKAHLDELQPGDGCDERSP